MTDNIQNEIEEDYIGEKNIKIEDFINPFFEDENYKLNEEQEYFGYIVKEEENEPNWTFYINVESKGKELGVAGWIPLGNSLEQYRDMEDFVKILDIFTNQGKKIIVNTKGNFADKIITNSNQNEVDSDDIVDKPIALEEFVNTVIEDIGLLKDGEEIIGYITRWHKEEPNWAFLMRVDRQGGYCGIAGHFDLGGKRELKEVIQVFNLFANKGMKIIVETDGYLVD
jgi:hypothetical protein